MKNRFFQSTMAFTVMCVTAFNSGCSTLPWRANKTVQYEPDNEYQESAPAYTSSGESPQYQAPPVLEPDDLPSKSAYNAPKRSSGSSCCH